MSIVFYTDPHLGLNRVANTTPASRAKLREALYDQIDRVLDADGAKVCVGDLFHTYSNDEETLFQGYRALRYSEVILAGNHDVTNRKDSIGSLQFLSTLEPGTVWITPFGEAGYQVYRMGNAVLFGVPHVASQALFEESLQRVCDEVDSGDVPRSGTMKEGPGVRILLLHANYECPFAEAETTLNLTEAWAEKLLERFDYIIMGHEHQPRDLFGGRLVILGNTHPTGFSDISDKRIAILEGGELRFEKIWDAKSGYKAYTRDTIPTATSAQFVRITGTVDAGDVGKVTKAVANLWKESDELYAVKLDIEVKTATVTADGTRIEVESLPATIRKELKGTSMLGLFEELLEKAS
jgi:DNA repair exonuclease SbcCD nuclease subunit